MAVLGDDPALCVGATVTVAAVRGTGDGGVGIVKRINDDGTLEARARRPTGPQREKASPRVAGGFA